MIRFSLVTSTYNREKCLARALKATCSQDYNPQLYEIVVVNNNSTDNTEKVCDEFIKKYPDRQIRVFKELSQGVSYAQNRAIKEARGEYMVYVDDDETIIKEHLSKIDEHLKNIPSAELCASPVLPIYEEKEPKWMSHFTQRLIGGYFRPGDKVKILGKKDYPGTGHTIIKRELYDKFGNFKTELGRKGTSLMGAEDKDMAFRLFENKVTCYYLPDVPIYHHIPKEKLTDDFFTNVTYSIGKSERLRTLSISKKSYRKRQISEGVKWCATLILFVFYLITLCPAKGNKLIEFRWNVTKGLLGK